jgi:hypothetical protein
MDKTTVVSVMCPRCGLTAKAKLDESRYRFIIYTCPRCNSNVACYDNKIDIISDRLLGDMIKKHRLKYCGDVIFSKKNPHPEPEQIAKKDEGGISSDKINDLKILLATESDFDKIISQL